MTGFPCGPVYTAPRIDGIPASVRAMATAYDELGAEIAAARTAVGGLLEELGPWWRGAGRDGLNRPVELFDTHSAEAARAMSEIARRLDDYAAALSSAESAHTSWWHKAVVVAAAVAVTASVVTVTITTVGAGTVEGALAGADALEAVDGMVEAATAADQAAGAVADELAEATGPLRRLAPLLRAWRPQLITAQVNAGVTAVADELLEGRISWDDVAVAAVTSFGAADEIDRLTPGVTAAFDGQPPWLEWLAQHAMQGAVWGVASGLSDGLEGHVHTRDMALGALTGSVGLLGREAHDLASVGLTAAGQTGGQWISSPPPGDVPPPPDMAAALRRGPHRKAAASNRTGPVQPDRVCMSGPSSSPDDVGTM